MKLIKSFFALSMLATCGSATPNELRAAEWDETSSRLPLFSKGSIRACKKCSTYVIVATKEPIGRDLELALRKISNADGNRDDNLAAVIKRAQVLEFSRDLVELRCSLPGKLSGNALFYADKRLDKCVTVPFDKEEILSEALEVIYGNIKNDEYVNEQVNSIAFRERVNSKVANLKEAAKELAPYLKEIVSIVLTRRAGGVVPKT